MIDEELSISDATLIARPLDEVFDTMMEVEQDPCGAWQAIQSQAVRIEELTAEREKSKALLLALILTATSFFCGLGWLIHEDLRNCQLRYEQCLAADKQWINWIVLK
jgi:hypothetical protein